MEETKPLQWRIGNTTGRTPALVIREDETLQAGMLVGYDILKHYRLTIDIERKKLLMEPAPFRR